MKDEILEEVWRARDEFAKKHNYDLEAMVAELQDLERQSSNLIIEKSEVEPNQGPPADPSSRRQ